MVAALSAPDLYEQIIASADAVYGGPHPGGRALHAKGTWTRGTFTATPEAARLSRAEHLQGGSIAALVRFSNASGNPQAHDAARDGRGIAVKLRIREGLETDILATTSPAFVTRTPEDFLELMRARVPDPETGQPDLEKLGAYVAAHPEAMTAAEAIQMREPLASFAQATYFNPHAFALLAADGTRTWVRWRFVSDLPEQRIPDDEARERGRDYLHRDLADRLRAGPVRFAFRIQLAADDDPLDDPTAVWPDDRELIEAGALELTGLADDPEGNGHIEVFDPTRVIDGIELSDDPILRARPKAYSVSAYRRLGST
jgi:catalase